MTRHERLTLGVSVAALVISICSPLVNYYWLQSEVRIRELKSEGFHVDPTVYLCENTQTMVYEIDVNNIGLWPIERVHLTFQKKFETINFDNKPYKPGAGLKFVFDKKNVKPDPPIDISVQEKADYLIVNFKDSLPPKLDMRLARFLFKDLPRDLFPMFDDLESLSPYIWVSSEVSSFDAFWDAKDDCLTVERIRRELSTP
jgi:hypothetical protein